MKLLTKEIREKLPKLYAQDKKGDDAVVYAKFFTPWTKWTWFVTEFDGEDTFFGLVQGHETEAGYFSLSELEAIKGPFGLKIERDMHFSPKTLGEIKKGLAARSA